jgi:dephospho-CoA kinase
VSWLICIGGGIASGKTTTAEALQASLPGSARLAFGEVVRRRVLGEGREPTRQNLQDTGLQLIAEGWPSFIDELLRYVEGEPEFLIVEGVRHQEAVNALHDRLPTRELLLVYLEVDCDQRRQRLAHIGEANDTLDHDVERDVSALRTTADLVVTTEQPTDELVQLVRQRVESRNR